MQRVARVVSNRLILVSYKPPVWLSASFRNSRTIDVLSDNSRRIGKVKLCFYLAVPAKFVTAEQNYTARLGEAVALDCLSEGDRPLSIAWSFNHGHIDWQYNTRCVPGRRLVESAVHLVHLVMQNRCYYTTLLVHMMTAHP